MAEKTSFTQGMKDVMRFARAEAGRLAHDYIGPEHYLLGIIRSGDGRAVWVLKNLGVDLEKLKLEVYRVVSVGKGAPPLGIYNPTDEAKSVIEGTKEITRQLDDIWIGPEHLLLSLIREETTLASQCLRDFGVTFDEARREVRHLFEGPVDPFRKIAHRATYCHPLSISLRVLVAAGDLTLGDKLSDLLLSGRITRKWVDVVMPANHSPIDSEIWKAATHGYHHLLLIGLDNLLCGPSPRDDGWQERNLQFSRDLQSSTGAPGIIVSSSVNPHPFGPDSVLSHGLCGHVETSVGIEELLTVCYWCLSLAKRETASRLSLSTGAASLPLD